MGEAWPNRGKTTSAAQSAPLCCLACQNGQEGETLSYVNTCVGRWYHVFPVITRSLQHRFCDDSCGSSSFPTEQPHGRESAFRKQYRYCDSKLGLSIRCRAHRLHFTRIVETGRPSLVCIVCHHVKLFNSETSNTFAWFPVYCWCSAICNVCRVGMSSERRMTSRIDLSQGSTRQDGTQILSCSFRDGAETEYFAVHAKVG